jgi:magnesium-transporting ATPase (P-type)
MTDSIASNQTTPAESPAPRMPAPQAEQGRPGTAAIVVGVVGSIVGAITFVIVWVVANVTLNSCRYGDHQGSVEVGRARIWLLLATIVWVTMPVTAGLLARRAGRNSPVWFVLAATFALFGIWAIVRLGPWELCM